MKVLSILGTALCLLALAATPALAASPAIGADAPTFSLTTIDGKPFSLADATKSNSLVVVMFISTQCPYSNAYNDRMPKRPRSRTAGVAPTARASNRRRSPGQVRDPPLIARTRQRVT